MDLGTTVELNNGVAIPQLGLGVFRSGQGGETRDAVLRALEVGYRHIDTAAIYRNEADVGEGVRASGLPRADVFVTTKLWNDDHGYDETLRAYDASLERLGLDYVDLYLMHWPVPDKRVESWRAMERLYKEGRCRAIGVSNFVIHHIDQLMEVAEVPPAVNQIELHPFLQRDRVVAHCRARGIAVEAYSPLTKGKHLDDPTLVAIAGELGRSVAQVLIRWSLDQGFISLPKSANPARIAENAAVFDFELTANQQERLADLEQDLHTAWNPDDVA